MSLIQSIGILALYSVSNSALESLQGEGRQREDEGPKGLTKHQSACTTKHTGLEESSNSM